MGVNVVRGFDLVKAWGQAFDTKPLIPMAGIIANEEYFHGAQGAVRHLPSGFEKRAQLDTRQPPKRGENRQKLPTPPLNPP